MIKIIKKKTKAAQSQIQRAQDLANAFFALKQWNDESKYDDEKIQPIFDNLIPRISKSQIKRNYTQL